MAIPEDIEDKLDHNPSWVIQHKDIVQLMDETTKDKPWSRYMIQQQLEDDPSKKTVKDRLDELVELEVLDNYEYRNVTLYDLAYDPIVTDGGSLRDANLLEVATLRDKNSVQDLGTGVFFTSFLLFGYGILSEQMPISADLALTGNFYMDAGILLYLLAFFIFVLVRTAGKVEELIIEFRNTS